MNGGLFANALYTLHQGQVGGRGLSPRVWGKARDQLLSPDGSSPSFMFGDDFLNHPTVAAAGTNFNGYAVAIDTGDTGNPVATETGGVVRMATAATDNNEIWMTSGGNLGVLGKISDTAADAKLTIFEARIRFTQVADNGGAVFVGLAEEGLAAANTKVDDTGVMADKDFIGFNTIHANGDLLSINYKKEGQTQQAVGSGSAIAAATWYKLGFVYDPLEPTSRRISFFIDNVEQTDYVTGTNIAAATFPDAEELAFLIGIKAGAAGVASVDIDWWNFYQQG